MSDKYTNEEIWTDDELRDDCIDGLRSILELAAEALALMASPGALHVPAAKANRAAVRAEIVAEKLAELSRRKLMRAA
jgi:hypothetical protein